MHLQSNTTTAEAQETGKSAQPVTTYTDSTQNNLRPRLVYFSSSTENTKHLVDRLPYEAERIPLRRTDSFLYVREPYILFVPSYGGGKEKSAVPKQVIKFLNEKSNRDLCLGIIAAGNMNFGAHYCIAARIISSKLHVPIFYKFEIRGMPGDKERIEEGIMEVFERYNQGELKTSGDIIESSES